MSDYGAYSLIPPLVVIVMAIITKQSFEPLVAGCAVGFLMISYQEFPNNFIQSLIKNLQDESLIWVILVCGLYGSLIHLLVLSGGINAFGKKALKYIDNSRKSLLLTWALGIFFFIDDYLNALATGTITRKISDKFNIPREMLAYTIGSTAASTCVLVPISTWAIYIGKLIEDTGLVAKGQGTSAFMKTVPFGFYAWFAVILVFLVIMGYVPIVGKMKKAFERVANGGALAPAGSENLSVQAEAFVPESQAKAIYLILPLIVLIVSTITMGIDALKGVITAVLFTIAFYGILKIIPYRLLSESIFEGFKSMIFALAILVMSYVLKAVGDQMGLTQYVINSLRGAVSKEMLAFLIFISLGSIAFATGSSWGIYAVAVPIVVTLAQALHANVWLALGAVISSGTFGAHACFYSDATILASAGSECNNLDHALTQLPYALMSASLAALCFLACGYMF